jgi:hypothetical protein
MFRTATVLAVALLALALPAQAAPKFKKTHFGVPPERMVNLEAVVDASSQEALTLDALGTPLILQKYALIVTDVIVTPIAAQDTTTPIWVNLSFGGRGFEIRRLGAQTHHVSLGGAIAATPNQPLGVSNASAVNVQVNVLGYLVDGAALASGVSPEQ